MHLQGKLPVTVRLARVAMATRFEVVLHGERPELLRAAAEEALEEVARVEEWLSPYRAGSALVRLNREAGRGWVRVDSRLFRFLERARELSSATAGAFDPTIGPLIRAWGFKGGIPVEPDPAGVQAAQNAVGWEGVEMDRSKGTIRFLKPGMEIHPGAMGKGHALDRAMECLRETGVESGLIHGGTSSVIAMGHPPDAEGWVVELPRSPVGWPEVWGVEGPPRVTLRDASLSVSAVWGRAEGTGCGGGTVHVLDPRLGKPVTTVGVAAVEMPLAEESDAWSTALLVGGVAMGGRLSENRKGTRWWVGMG
jgi:thiamine biosynthesis lipoprotein